MKNRMIDVQYDAPRIDIFEVLTEQGFSLSAGNEQIGDKKEDIEW